MSELRWTLLILGVVFIAALTWWERRRPRQAFAPRLREPSLSHGEAHRDASPEGAPPAEPWIGESALSDVVLSDRALADAPQARVFAGDASARAPLEPPPAPLEELPTLVISESDDPLALEAAWGEAPPEPMLVDPEASARVERTDPAVAPESGPSPASAPIEPTVPPVAPSGEGAARLEPIVDWPPEESRRILSLRLVASAAERFPGRALRLALAAEGFVLGKFSIFHKPDETNRAVLSAASLTRPGAFDLETMDSQRYVGLSLFAVLPGSRTPQQAFEELLASARNLNERLEGALQDERGGPLTPLRVASLRESLRAEAPTLPAASADE